MAAMYPENVEEFNVYRNRDWPASCYLNQSAVDLYIFHENAAVIPGNNSLLLDLH